LYDIQFSHLYLLLITLFMLNQVNGFSYWENIGSLPSEILQGLVSVKFTKSWENCFQNCKAIRKWI